MGNRINMESCFDLYAFADYSGATDVQSQKRHIALSVYERGGAPLMTRTGLTRQQLEDAAMELLWDAQERGKRMILGFDHNYSFPTGWHEALFGTEPDSWEQLLQAYVHHSDRMHPREWAVHANGEIARRLEVAQGPFWGTRFAPKPPRELFEAERRLPNGWRFRLDERRLVETCCRTMKPVYQVGGIGTVGQQTLFGLHHLHRLMLRSRECGIPLHVWPQMGAELPRDSRSHLVVEVYPTFCLPTGLENRVKRSDEGDAEACVRWMCEEDEAGRLPELMQAPFAAAASDPVTRRRILLEGWVLGVRLPRSSCEDC